MKGSPVRKKVALFSTLFVLAASLVAASSASAAYLGVTVTPTEYVACQPEPGSVGMLLGFKAKVTARGTTKPSKIRIGFQVLDSETKRVIRSGVVNLKRSKGYKAKTPGYVLTDGQMVSYHVNMSYKGYGKTRKLKKTYNSVAPTQAELDQAGIPAC